jgi:hypothetical protein
MRGHVEDLRSRGEIRLLPSVDRHLSHTVAKQQLVIIAPEAKECGEEVQGVSSRLHVSLDVPKLDELKNSSGISSRKKSIMCRKEE